MKVGILFPMRISGGVFQNALSIADSLLAYSSYELTLFYYYDEDPYLFLASPPADVKRVSVGSGVVSPVTKFWRAFFPRRETCPCSHGGPFRDVGIYLLILPFPTLFAYYNKVPYLYSVPDLMHKYYPQFPEYPAKERRIRDYRYKRGARHSLLTVVDSEQSKDDLHRFYGISSHKIRTIPFYPPGYIFRMKDMDREKAGKLLEKHHLPEKFLFYPANFWYHKNHIRLVQALYRIKTEMQIEIPLVLTGSRYGNYEEVRRSVAELGLDHQVYYLGYVSNEELVALHKRSAALVFPTLIGPTNIPPLEAMVLGNPVACSNLFEMPDQLGEAALLFDPFSVEDIAHKIHSLWSDDNMRKSLIEKGYQRVKGLTLENHAGLWNKILDESFEILSK